MGGRGDWVVVDTFPTRQAADFVWSVLDGHDVPARVTGDDAGGLAPHIGLVTGGPSVLVPADRLEEARAILDWSAQPSGDDGVHGG